MSSRKRPRSSTDDDIPDSKKSSKKSTVSGPEPRDADGVKQGQSRVKTKKGAKVACSDETLKGDEDVEPFVIENGEDAGYTELNSVEKSKNHVTDVELFS